MKYLSNFSLKIIGIVTMTIDHIGYFYHIDEFRIIGRIAFPIFAFLIGEGYKYTSNKKRYALRLLLMAIIIQVPMYIFKMNVPMNIFFTLFLGLALIYSVELDKNIIVKVLLSILVLLIGYYIDVDYGIYGIVLILVFYITKGYTMFFAILVYNLFFHYFFPVSNYQVLSIMSLVFIMMYNNKLGRRMKYFFYFYYPIHLIVLYYSKYIFE